VQTTKSGSMPPVEWRLTRCRSLFAINASKYTQPCPISVLHFP
jgi:hypothetical protein